MSHPSPRWILYWIEEAPLGKYYAGPEGNLHRWTDDIEGSLAFDTREEAETVLPKWGPCVRVQAA